MSAGSWMEMKPAVDGIAAKVAKLPPPPQPDDAWSEKVNTLNRTMESMVEQVDSRIQAEEEL
jgi:hypothetical protein